MKAATSGGGKRHIGMKLQEAMDEKNVRPAQLARDFGVKPPSVYEWTKYGRIAKNRIPQLATYFGKSVAWFLDAPEGAEGPAPSRASQNTKEEGLLLTTYRALPKKSRDALMVVARALLMQEMAGQGAYPFTKKVKVKTL